MGGAKLEILTFDFRPNYIYALRSVQHVWLGWYWGLVRFPYALGLLNIRVICFKERNINYKDLFTFKLDRVGPIDNRPSIN